MTEEPLDHAATAHLDTPKERAIRNDYDDADAEIQILKAELRHVRMIPLAEEVQKMFWYRNLAKYYEDILRRFKLSHHIKSGGIQ